MCSLSAALLLPHKSLRSISLHRLPASKSPILIRGLLSNRRLGGSSRGCVCKSMTEFAKDSALRDTGGVEVEAEAVLGNGSSRLTWDELELSLNRLSKWLVAPLFGLAILWKQDAEALWAATGAVVNAWLSFTLKRILHHKRPVSGLRSDPGMPSSHAQSIFYVALFSVLSIIKYLGINMLTLILGILILACSSYLSWLRISQHLHTINQVLVGAALGSTCAITWFWMWHSFVFRTFIASIWIRIIVVLGSAAYCVGFLLFVNSALARG